MYIAHRHRCPPTWRKTPTLNQPAFFPVGFKYSSEDSDGQNGSGARPLVDNFFFFSLSLPLPSTPRAKHNYDAQHGPLNRTATEREREGEGEGGREHVTRAKSRWVAAEIQGREDITAVDWSPLTHAGSDRGWTARARLL